MLERFLASRPTRCSPASNGQDALESLKTTREIDLVVTDVPHASHGRAPAPHGAIKRLRPHLPAIAMTAYGTEETAIEALRAGATNYLRKPFKTAGIPDRRPQGDRARERAQEPPSAFAYLRESHKDFEVPARLEAARSLLPHLTEGLPELGIVEAQDVLNLEVALEEALGNAIVHGALELTEEAHKLRTRPRRLRARLQRPPRRPEVLGRTVTATSYGRRLRRSSSPSRTRARASIRRRSRRRRR